MAHMARSRLSMRKVKQILRLKFELAMSNRAISSACNVGRETVRDRLPDKVSVLWSDMG